MWYQTFRPWYHYTVFLTAYADRINNNKRKEDMDMRIEESINAAAGILDTMTDTKVQKTQKAFADFMDNAAKSNVTGVADVNSKNSVDISSSAQNDSKNAADLSDDKKNSDISQTQDSKTDSSKNTDAVNSKDNSTVKNGNVNENAIDESEEVVAQIESAIISMLAQQLGVTVEEVSVQLQNMGMSAIDLLDDSNLLEFTMQINGVEDVAVVLTDENLMTQFKELSDDIDLTVRNVLAENNISQEELPVIIENVKTGTVSEEEIEINVQKTDSDTTQKVTDVENTEEVEVVVDNTKSARQDSDSFTQQHNNNEHQDVSATFNQQNQIVGNIVDAAESAVSYVSADMEDIVNQIVEQIKVQVNADTSSMEMQLNPESYGKLQLQVLLKDGIVTARMNVENEAVRQALESQVVQLRESMNNQGLKVDAIEVTVASHEFDRNLQQESNANQQAFEEEQRKSSVRRMNLNLNADDWSEEDIQNMSDAEALERKIMLESGNRMSIQA